MIQEFIRNKRVSINKALQEEVRWIWVLFYFTMNGAFVYYTLNKNRIFALETNFIGLILVVLTVGILYGIISNFIFGFLFKVSGKMFGSKNSIRQIFKAITFAYKPYLIIFFIIIFELCINHYHSNAFIRLNQVLVNVVLTVLLLVKAVLVIWSTILLLNALKSAQGSHWRQFIFSYIIGGLLYSPFYYLIFIKLK